MPPAAIETHGLTKVFGRHAEPAVDDVSMVVPTGSIHGLLGPNGAGKSTTMRMLLGLVRPTDGSARVLGGGPGHELRRIGAFVEAPAFYPHLSARRNLDLLARLTGRGRQRIDEVLATVSLGGRADDRVDDFSSGMKQRLSVAAAILHDPELLILDEPTSGLDPEGVVQMRQLIRSLAGGDRTVVLSSHLLHEIEQVCETVTVLQRGRVRYEGPVGQLRGDPDALLLRAEPADRVEEALRGLGVDVERDGDGFTVYAEAGRAPEVARAVIDADLRLLELRPRERSLEEAFLALTEEDGR